MLAVKWPMAEEDESARRPSEPQHQPLSVLRASPQPPLCDRDVGLRLLFLRMPPVSELMQTR